MHGSVQPISGSTMVELKITLKALFGSKESQRKGGEVPNHTKKLNGA